MGKGRHTLFHPPDLPLPNHAVVFSSVAYIKPVFSYYEYTSDPSFLSLSLLLSSLLKVSRRRGRRRRRLLSSLLSLVVVFLVDDASSSHLQAFCVSVFRGALIPTYGPPSFFELVLLGFGT